MDIIKRDKYCFSGSSAKKSVQYFDLVVSHGYNGNMDYLAWDAAHKFGSRMTTDFMASFRDGITIGLNALPAAEFIDTEYKKAFASCDEFGRSKRMKELMLSIYTQAEKKYDVVIKLL